MLCIFSCTNVPVLHVRGPSVLQQRVCSARTHDNQFPGGGSKRCGIRGDYCTTSWVTSILHVVLFSHVCLRETPTRDSWRAHTRVDRHCRSQLPWKKTTEAYNVQLRPVLTSVTRQLNSYIYIPQSPRPPPPHSNRSL